MTPLLALLRKEFVVLFGSPMAYLSLTVAVLVTSLIFFDHLRIYNQILFLYSSTNMGGFETGTIPDYINLRDTVFFPVMENVGFILIFVVPLVTMRIFSEEKARGTDELLMTTRLTATQIVLGKFSVTLLFVLLMMAVAFIYPTIAIQQGGLGFEHLLAVFLGLTALAIGIAAIGLACSAFSSSQLVAAVSAYGIAFILYDFSWTNAFVSEPVGNFLDALSMQPRFGTFAEGFVSLANLLYFAGMVAVAFVLARFSLDWTRVR